MKKEILLILFVALAVSCNSPAGDASKTPEITDTDQNELRPGKYAHSVYVWLKNPESDAERNTFETSMRLFLDQLPYATTRHLGTPADTRRDIIDFSYTYSVLLTFDSREDLQKYDTDPAHLAFLESSSHLWKKILIYDSVNLLEQ